MRLPALEKNILVYRSLQMSLFLFYAEALRRQLTEAVGRTFREKNLKGGKLMRRIFQHLESDGTINSKESIEIQNLLDYRNRIAHDIQLLTADIEIPGRNYNFSKYLRDKYDYEALGKIKSWEKELPHRLSKKYILNLSFHALHFEAAEQAYEKESSALEKRINRQYRKRIERLKRSNA